MVIVAVPVASTGTVPPNADPSTLNATPPLVTGEPSDVTVAVNVTASPTSDGFRLDDTCVVVAEAVCTVRHHPPPIEPASPVASSTTHRLQVPLGLEPSKVDRAVAPL